MNDRIPGSSYYNPIWYRGYRIYLGDRYDGMEYEFVHDDFDGADDARDRRCGSGHTVKECEEEINALEDN